MLRSATTLKASCANILEKTNVSIVKNSREVHMYLHVPLTNALKAFTFLRSAELRWNAPYILKGTTEILQKSRRLGGENVIINPLNKLD